MKTKQCVSRNKYIIFTMTVLLVIFNMDTYGWYISGTVKDTSGTALEGVSVK